MNMEVLKIIGLTFAGWLVHLGTVSLYLSKFTTTHSLLFRSFHVLEIGVNMLVVFSLYFFAMNGSLSPLAALSVALVVLMVLDGILFAVSPAENRQLFDHWHVVAAYSVVSIVIILLGYFARS